METQKKIDIIKELLKQRSFFYQDHSAEVVRTLRIALQGDGMDSKERKTLRVTMTDKELAEDDALIKHGVSKSGDMVDFFELSGGYTATKFNGSDENSFCFAFSPLGSVDPGIEEVKKGAFMLYRPIHKGRSNQSIKEELETVATDIKSLIDSGESPYGAALTITLKNNKKSCYKIFTILNEDVSAEFRDKNIDLSKYIRAKADRESAEAKIQNRIEPGPYEEDECTSAWQESTRQIEAIKVIRKIAQKDGWKVPLAFEIREKELIKVQAEVEELWNRKAKEEERRKEEVARKSREQIADSSERRSKSVQETSIDYADNQIGNKIRDIRQSIKGKISERNVMDAGEVAFESASEIVRKLAEYKEELEKSRGDCIRYYEKLKNDYNEYKRSNVKEEGVLADLIKRQDEILKNNEELKEKEKDIQNKTALAMRDFLASIRPMTEMPEREFRSSLTKNPTHKDAKILTRCAMFYPKEMAESMTEMPLTVARDRKRGYFDIMARKIVVHGDTDTCFHELGHYLERSCPIILKLEQSFYDRRTAGCKLESLRDITKNKSYDWSEKTRRDKFINVYMGKDYSGSSYEIVSMGFEMFYTRPNELIKDPDYFKFILGILTVVTP